MRLLDFYIIWRGDMLFATVVPIAYFLLYLKKQTSDICLFEICNGICDMFVLGNIRLYFFLFIL